MIVAGNGRLISGASLRLRDSRPVRVHVRCLNYSIKDLPEPRLGGRLSSEDTHRVRATAVQQRGRKWSSRGGIAVQQKSV